MKASLSVVLALAGACVAVRAEAQAVVVGPRSGSMAALPGAQVTVPIVADLSGSGGASLGSITARLLWHPSVLAYRGVSAGTLGAPVINADSAGGSLRFALADPAGATGQPVLVNAIFSVVGAVGAADSLWMNLQELTGAGGTFADLLSIGSATSSRLCVSTGLFGDLDALGTVTSADALAIVTSAVGLPLMPPFTTVNGDVDGNGTVDTRDALIVLSYVVGLPVVGFRVGRLNGGTCAVQAPASVQIQPGGVAVVTGDRFPLVAVVRDSNGAVVEGIGLVWTSADTTVVKADATGALIARAAGTAKVFANAAPGLKDSVTVTVSATRRVWYVNPAVASLHGGTELGSSAYPFSTIDSALTRAAAGDSVMIAPATYGETVHITMPLTLVGDSTAAGVTTIRNPLGPGILVDNVTSGLVRIDHVRIEDSQGGVIVRGVGSGVVDLRRILVAGSRGVGIAVRRVAQATLDSVAVQGAILRGVDLDSVPVVRLHAVAVDFVEQGGAGGQNVHAIAVHMADSLSVDSVALTTAGFLLDTARVALFDHVTVTLGTTSGPALRVNGGQRLSVRRSRIVGPDTTLLLVNSTAAVGLNQLEITGAAGMFMDTTGGSFAARVLLADSVALDSLWIHDNGASAIAVDTARVILLRWSRIEGNYLALPAATPGKAVRLAGFRRVRVTQSIVDLGGAASVSDGIYLQGIAATLGPLGGARVQVDSSTFLGGHALAVFGVSRLLHDTLGMDGLRAIPAMTSRTRGVFAVNVGFLEAKGIEVDSSSWAGTGLYATYIGGFDVQNSRFTHTGGAVGIEADTSYVGATPTNPGPGVFTGNTVECDSAVSSVQYVVNLGYVAPVTVTNNSLQGHCVLGILAANTAAGAPQGSAVMTDNWVSSDTGGTMLSLQGAYKNALVARNTTTPGVLFFGSGSSVGMDSARIENNVVRGNWRGGIFSSGAMRATTLRGNSVDSVPTNSSFPAIDLSLATAGTTTRLIGNRVSRALKDGIRLLATDTTLLDSNVVVDSRIGITGSGKIVGRWNYVGRNYIGISMSGGTLRIDSSSIVDNHLGAQGSSSTNLADNWWGNAAGPAIYPLGAWVVLAALDVPMQFFATGAALAADRIFVAGGNGTPGAVRSYDRATLTWTSRPSLPSGQVNAAVVAVGDTVFAIGGSPTLGMVARYDTVSNTWTTRRPMPSKRSGVMAASVANRIYTIGGWDSTVLRAVATVEEYDPTTDTWTTKATMPTARFGAGVAVYNGLIYVIGGRVGTTWNVPNLVNVVEVYDPATNFWTTRPAAPVSGPNPAGVAQGRIYVIGGGTFFDPTANAWYPDASGGTRYHSAGIAVRDTLYSFGGSNNYGSIPDGQGATTTFTFFPYFGRFVPAAAGGGLPPNSVSGSLVYAPYLASPPARSVIGAPAAFRAPVLAASRAGAPFLSAGATRAVTPAARSGRTRPRLLGRASSPSPVRDPLMMPTLPVVDW